MEQDSGWGEKLNEYKIPLALSLVGIVLVIGGLFSSGIIQRTFIKSSKQITAAPKTPANQTAQSSFIQVKVDVSGEVKTPGVYSLASDARIEDAIKAAGGVKSSADPNFLTKSINLAQKISDGMKIYIPKVGEPASQVVSQTGVVSGVATENVLIDLNNSSASELDTLPGVGETTAQKIIEGRPYSSIEELLTKKAVNRATYEKIKSKVRI